MPLEKRIRYGMFHGSSKLLNYFQRHDIFDDNLFSTSGKNKPLQRLNCITILQTCDQQNKTCDQQLLISNRYK